MACQVTLAGQLLVNPNGCCGGCSGGGAVAMTAKALSIGCGSSSSSLFEAVESTTCPVQVTTPGLPGAAWVDLPGFVGDVSLLMVQTDLKAILRLGAAEAELEASVAYPVTLLAPEALEIEVDGVALTANIAAGSVTAQALAAAINVAAVGAGLAFLPASVSADTGRPVVRSSSTGVSSVVEATTGVSALGFATGARATGAGSDVAVQGLFLAQFNPPLARVQVSGNARVDVLSAR